MSSSSISIPESAINHQQPFTLILTNFPKDYFLLQVVLRILQENWSVISAQQIDSLRIKVQFSDMCDLVDFDGNRYGAGTTYLDSNQQYHNKEKVENQIFEDTDIYSHRQHTWQAPLNETETSLEQQLKYKLPQTHSMSSIQEEEQEAKGHPITWTEIGYSLIYSGTLYLIYKGIRKLIPKFQ